MNKEHERCRRNFTFLSTVSRPILWALFNYSYERIPKTDGPYLLLCNHNTDLDPGMVSVAAPELTYFVATENITRMGLVGRAFMKAYNPILHRKGVQSPATVRAILARIKEGFSVALFPEGNRSFNGLTCPISSATGKLARISGATLITYRISGGYLSTPRWGRGIRRGKTEGHVAGVYTPAMLKKMTPAEIQQAVERDLYEDAYADQKKKPVRFKGLHRAEYLESTLYLCPECGRVGTMRSKGNRVVCSCGLKMKYSEFGMLSMPDGTEKSVTELDTLQRQAIPELLETAGEKAVFSDTVTVQRVNNEHEIISKKTAVLSGYADRLEIGDFVIPFDKLEGIAINQRNLLILRVADEETGIECVGDVRFNALKYLYLARNARASRNGIL